jgi:F-type H+-transporting ATPase subunit b
LKNEIIEEARAAAKTEAFRMVEKAREQIDRERKEAVANIRQQVGLMSLEIAEKILKEELRFESTRPLL